MEDENRRRIVRHLEYRLSTKPAGFCQYLIYSCKIKLLKISIVLLLKFVNEGKLYIPEIFYIALASH